MKITIDLGNDVKRWNEALALLTERNSSSIGAYPLIYDASTTGQLDYRPEENGREEWLTIPEIMQRGVADCEDLAAGRAAELRAMGCPASARIVRTGRDRRTGSRIFHGLVTDEAGQIVEDPTKILKIQEVVRRGGFKPWFELTRQGQRFVVWVGIPAEFENKWGIPAGHGYAQYNGTGNSPEEAMERATDVIERSYGEKTLGAGNRAIDGAAPGLVVGADETTLEDLLKSDSLALPQYTKQAALALAQNDKTSLQEALAASTPTERATIEQALGAGSKKKAIETLLKAGGLTASPWGAAAMLALGVMTDDKKRNALTRALKRGSLGGILKAVF